MPSNARIILDELLRQRQDEIDPSAKASEFFELFTAEQILKDADLSYEEIESGLVGDGGDGGIDGFYLFVNGELVGDEFDYSHLRRGITLDIVIIQSKMAPGFKDTPIERFITVSDDIFDLSKPPSTFAAVYNSTLVESIQRFRDVHDQIGGTLPAIRISYSYACKGEKPELSAQRKVEKLKTAVAIHFPSAEVTFAFLGASDLLDLARREPQRTYTLPLAENPISSEGMIGFVCLVRIRDFFGFITDGGQLRRQIFEANVRDYQGRTEVNDEIQQSLQDAGRPEDFWWLNNGVTMLAAEASQAGKTLTLKDPQIVNGLQTSTEVFNYCSRFNTDRDGRKVLVRVIVPSESASRDRIIKATNSQTAVQPASLRATDKVHRDIEEYLRPRGLFYDRRKNFYKNENKARDRVIGIPYLAQAVMAIVLQQPNTARARPASLLKKDEDYKKVYSSKHPIALYYVCAEAVRKVEAYLKSPAGGGLTTRDRNNLRFYVAMHSVACLTGKKNATAAEVAGVDLAGLDEAVLEGSLEVVRKEYSSLGGSDQVAKGAVLVDKVRERLGVSLS